MPIKRTFFFPKRERDGFTRVALVLIFEMGLYVSIEGDTYPYTLYLRRNLENEFVVFDGMWF